MATVKRKFEPKYCSFCGQPLANTEWQSNGIDAYHESCIEPRTDDEPKVVKAIDIVAQVLDNALPPNVPSSVKKITGARFTGSSRTHITAELVMFDGRPAKLECYRLRHSWAHRWTSLEGGSLKWDSVRNEWRRVFVFDEV